MNRFQGLRDFLLIWAGQLISAVGSRLSIFALGIWVLRTTGSTTEFALTYLAMDVPVLLISPLAGPLVDRWNRRRLMMACDALCALTTFVLAVLLAANQLQVWHAYIGVAVLALCSAFHEPALQASIPLLATEEQLPRVNGMVQTSSAIAAIVGPLLAGVLVSTISLYGVLAVDGISFIAGVIGVALARVPQPKREAHEAEGSVLQDALEGWRYIRARGGLMGLLLMNAFKGLVFSIASVLITPLLLSFADPALVGVQYATSGAGLLIGGLAMAWFGAPKQRVPRIIALNLVCGVFLALHGVWPSFALAVGAGFTMFLTLPMAASLNATLWQRKVPTALQGRCFAMQQVLRNGVTPLGYVIAGPLAERVFDPLLMPGGALASTVGSVIGVGAGRGTGLLFILLGISLVLAALAASGVAAIRGVDHLPDAVTADQQSHAKTDEPPPVAATGLRESLDRQPEEAQESGMAGVLAARGVAAD